MIERTYNLERQGYKKTENCINNSIKCIFSCVCLSFIILIVFQLKYLIEDYHNKIEDKYVIVNGKNISCEEYSRYRAYDSCKEEWKIPMG